MDILWRVLSFLIFPGFLFTMVIGLFSTWIDRKVTARVQWRKGPPLLQPFYDIVKLWGKETTLPLNGSPVIFLMAPVIGLAGITIVSTILWTSNLCTSNLAGGTSISNLSFIGDLIVVVYLLTLPSLAIIIGGSASGNPLASLGASREIKLLLAYELPFLLCIVTLILKADGSIQLKDLISNQPLYSISGVICLIMSLLCIQAKLGFVPFDIAEAETEVMGGPYIEYSGPALSIFKITQAMMLFTLPVFIISLFFGGMSFYGWEILWSLGKYVLILVIIIVVKNTNPRVRIDQAVTFFWKYCGFFALIALILAIVGKIYGINWL
jgi:NADH-quinone oxidoreductase subunit H